MCVAAACVLAEVDQGVWHNQRAEHWLSTVGLLQRWPTLSHVVVSTCVLHHLLFRCCRSNCLGKHLITGQDQKFVHGFPIVALPILYSYLIRCCYITLYILQKSLNNEGVHQTIIDYTRLLKPMQEIIMVWDGIWGTFNYVSNLERYRWFTHGHVSNHYHLVHSGLAAVLRRGYVAFPYEPLISWTFCILFV